MAAILPNSIFLHIPKTGGVWVREVLKQNGLLLETIRSRTPYESTDLYADSWHTVPTWHGDFYTKPRFCFVRHPLTWYASYWAFREHKNIWRENTVLELCRSSDFNDFIDNVISYGLHLEHLYRYYTDYALFVGKQETLHDDLAYVLRRYEGVEVDTCVDRKNEMPAEFRQRAMYSRENAARIIDLERGVVRWYGYNYIPDGIII